MQIRNNRKEKKTMEFETTETAVPMENSSSSSLGGVSPVLVVLVVALLIAGVALVLRKKK
mgnify:CR=1 FL=1